MLHLQKPTCSLLLFAQKLMYCLYLFYKIGRGEYKGKGVHGENKSGNETRSDCVYNSGKITCCQCVLKVKK